MKLPVVRILIVAVAVVCSDQTYAQNWSEINSTNVGSWRYTYGAGALNYSIRTNAGGGWAWQFTDSGNNAKFHVGYPDGYVGIGTSVPRSPLEINVAGDNNSVQTGLIIQQTNSASPNNKAGVSLGFGITNNTYNHNILAKITVKETFFSERPKMIFSLWDIYHNWQDRMVIDTYGQVGIGAENPVSTLDVRKLDVNDGQTVNLANFTFGGQNHFNSPTEGRIVLGSQAFSNGINKRAEVGFSNSGTAYGGALKFYTAPNDVNNNPQLRMMINHTGRVGIGTDNPASSLDVRKLDVSDGQTVNLVNFTFGGQNHFNSPTEGRIVLGSQAFSNEINKRAEVGFSNSGTAYGGALKFYTAPNDVNYEPQLRMTINHIGRVGIGTSNPDAMLTVNGDIHAKEVTIDVNIPVPDYVFEKEYDLPSLQQVESYIKQNKHLPEVPSGKTIEETGLNVMEMNLILLKKVEELTLYIIEQNKKMVKQSEMIDLQNRRISRLEKSTK